jgi:cell division protein FtsB
MRSPGTLASLFTLRLFGLRRAEDERVRQRGATPDVETRLRAAIVQLKTTIANKNAELRRLRSDVLALVRVINQLSLENQQLREALARSDPTVIAFPDRRG